MAGKNAHTVVLDLRGLHWASQQAVASSVLGRRSGVLDVAVNPVAQAHDGHPGGADSVRSPHDAMGHRGHDGMSMASMVRDMRNRFLVAALFAVPILVWSPIGHDVFGLDVAVPFGLREDVWSLLLSLPVVLYADAIFFDGAVRALRARTLDMMVLVAVAVGSGWLYSLAVTLTGGGDVFFEAVSVLSAFVLLGHWFEIRARGGANDAIRALLNLAPPKAVVLRERREVEVATAAIAVGDLMLVRPGSKIAWTGSRGRGQRGQRVHGHRAEHAGAQGDRRERHRGHHQHQPSCSEGPQDRHGR